MTRPVDRPRSKSDAGSARRVLFELQVEQHGHDETYHREIARLSLHHRLNHMALHFAKYTGKAAASTDVIELRRIYVDVLIIVLSTANVLNTELWELIEEDDREYPGLLAFGRSVALKALPTDDHEVLVRATAIATGQIAAACEKIDHLEPISFRSEIKAGLAKLAAISLAILSRHGQDPAAAVRQRLSEVKQRLKLHGWI
jgi:hypothetical protein